MQTGLSSREQIRLLGPRTTNHNLRSAHPRWYVDAPLLASSCNLSECVADRRRLVAMSLLLDATHGFRRRAASDGTLVVSSTRSLGICQSLVNGISMGR